MDLRILRVTATAGAVGLGCYFLQRRRVQGRRVIDRQNATDESATDVTADESATDGPDRSVDTLDGEFRTLQMDSDRVDPINPRVSAAEGPAGGEQEQWSVLLEVPRGSGLLISLAGCGKCELRSVPNQPLAAIHPHVHAPISLHGSKALGGGGSGVTIFRGVDEVFGDVVIKHGGHKDTAELFALAQIAHELHKRSNQSESAAKAAAAMRRRTPSFKFIYISTEHLWSRSPATGAAMGAVFGASAAAGQATKLHQPGGQQLANRLQLAREMPPGKCQMSPDKCHLTNVRRGSDLLRINIGKQAASPPDVLGAKGPRHEIVVTDQASEQCDGGDMALVGGLLQLFTGPAQLDAESTVSCQSGYPLLAGLCESVQLLQKSHQWKVSLAQGTIGGVKPTTGAKLLHKGLLSGDLLDGLTRRMISTIRDLQQLTHHHEALRVSHSCNPDLGPANITEQLDASMGFAVKKNYRPLQITMGKLTAESGRFARLRWFGTEVMNGELPMGRADVEPAQWLSRAVQEGAHLLDLFESGPSDHPSVCLGVLMGAHSETATPVWNCGLSDAGLHNLFLGHDGLWLFDMGQPAVMTQPALLTKFLMSFFHTLGMEEHESKSKSWVNRFELVGEGERKKLKLTDDSKQKLGWATAAFRTTLQQLVQQLFGGQQQTCKLLVRYSVLQLLSDAGFCLQVWQSKGGGDMKRWRPPSLEKWLWRALWDVWAASYVESVHWLD